MFLALSQLIGPAITPFADQVLVEILTFDDVLACVGVVITESIVLY